MASVYNIRVFQSKYETFEKFNPNGKTITNFVNMLFWDGIDTYFDHFYKLVWINPFDMDYTEKWQSVEAVLSMESTKQYIEWYKQCFLPYPVCCIYSKVENKLMSINRRRILAARAANITKILAFVEVGKCSDFPQNNYINTCPSCLIF